MVSEEEKEKIKKRAEQIKARQALGPRGPGCFLPGIVAPIVFFILLWQGIGFGYAILIGLGVFIILLIIAVLIA